MGGSNEVRGVCDWTVGESEQGSERIGHGDLITQARGEGNRGK